MRSRDANDQLNVQRASHPALPAEYETMGQGHKHPGRQGKRPARLLVTPPSHMYPPISTERIMRAVEQQQRITQQLEVLCARQHQRAVVLRRTGMKLIAGVSFSLGILTLVFILLSVFQPDLLVRLLTLLSDTIATPVAMVEGIKPALLLIPSNSWLFSGAALAIVLLMGMWLRLMRYPQEV